MTEPGEWRVQRAVEGWSARLGRPVEIVHFGRAPQRSKFGVCRVVYVAETDEKARNDMRDSYNDIIKWEIVNTPHHQNERVPEGGTLDDITFDMLVDNGNLFVGSPETVYRRVLEFYEQVGGFGLLIVQYYFHAEAFLIDPGVMPLRPWQAIAISMASLAAGWFAYDLICRSKIGGNTVPTAIGLAGIPCTRIENACPSGSDAFRVGAMAQRNFHPQAQPATTLCLHAFGEAVDHGTDRAFVDVAQEIGRGPLGISRDFQQFVVVHEVRNDRLHA